MEDDLYKIEEIMTFLSNNMILESSLACFYFVASFTVSNACFAEHIFFFFSNRELFDIISVN